MDAKLTPRQLATMLSQLDEIERHSRNVREQLISAMAERRGRPDPDRGTTRALKRTSASTRPQRRPK